MNMNMNMNIKGNTSARRIISGFSLGSRGFGIVEIIVALGLLATMFGGISAVMQMSIRTQRAMTMRRTAVALAEEGMEVVRFERDSNLITFWSRAVDTDLFPEYVGSIAQLTETNPGLVNGRYDRKIRLKRVYRDIAGDIAPAGTEDTLVRNTVVAVTWTDPFNSVQTYAIEAYLMRISQ